MMGILNNIRKWLHCSKKSYTDKGGFNKTLHEQVSNCKEFIIYDKEEPIAELKVANPNEQFWIFYDLDPLLSNDAIIARLYSDDFWLSKDIGFSTQEPNMPCKFLLAININEKDPEDPNEEIKVNFAWNDANGNIVSLADRPKQLLLRGPYPVEAINNSIQEAHNEIIKYNNELKGQMMKEANKGIK